MKAVITVLGKDNVGILAKVSNKCAQERLNILEVTQSVLQDMFAMIMLVEFENDTAPSFDRLTTEFDKLGDEIGTKIHIMHEDIFNSMHKI
ncbi:MAG: ACT domain-containing protein [Eubacteriales bacterium]|nr:ACT domain-containing protein [Eubacteriales bacterium]